MRTSTATGSIIVNEPNIRPASPRELLSSVLQRTEDPYDRLTVFSEFLVAAVPQDMRDIVDDETTTGILLEICKFWFDYFYAGMANKYPKPGETKAKAVQRVQKENAERIATRKAKIVKAQEIRGKLEKVIEVRAQARLLEMVMPNGKMLTNCSGAELRLVRKQLPTWLDKWIDRVKPRQLVGNAISEEELRKLAPKGWV